MSILQKNASFFLEFGYTGAVGSSLAIHSGVFTEVRNMMCVRGGPTMREHCVVEGHFTEFTCAI